MNRLDIHGAAATLLWQELIARLPNLTPQILDEIESAFDASLQSEADSDQRAVKMRVLNIIRRARAERSL